MDFLVVINIDTIEKNVILLIFIHNIIFQLLTVSSTLFGKLLRSYSSIHCSATNTREIVWVTRHQKCKRLNLVKLKIAVKLPRVRIYKASLTHERRRIAAAQQSAGR